MTLTGRSAVITGANQGLGLAIAHAFVREGASIMICARDAAKLDTARQELQTEASAPQKIVACAGDVSSRSAVAAMTDRAISEFGAIDILVNNAGIYGPMGRLEEIDIDDWLAAIAINLFGIVYTCRAVLPHMRAKKYGKIINLSGGGATAPLPYISAYAASKAAVVRLTETLADECAGSGIDVNSIAPGALNTRLLDEVLAAGPATVGPAFYEKMVQLKNAGGTPLEKGAALCVFLASAASDGISGRLISAVWDPWASLAERRSELKNSDIYTLRRIVPADRGQKWE